MQPAESKEPTRYGIWTGRDRAADVQDGIFRRWSDGRVLAGTRAEMERIVSEDSLREGVVRAIPEGIT